MKKLFFFLAAVAALGSCAKEPVGDGNSPVSNIQPISVEAVAPDSSDEPDMKTTLVNDAKVHWVKGDKIKVMFVPINGSYEISQNMYEKAYDGAQGVLQSTLESDYAAKATFSTDSWDWGPGAGYMGVGIAVYPSNVYLYSNRQKNYYNSNSVTQISYNLPSDQTAVANSFQNGIAFSYAEIALENKDAFAAGNAKLEFKNACALINIVLPNDADDVVSVKVESANGTLSGNYKVPTSGFDIVHNLYQTYYPKFPLTLESDGGVNYVTLSPEGETFQAGGSYYIVAWPGTHSGLTFTFTNTKGQTLVKNVNAEVVLKASEYDKFTFKNSFVYENIFEVTPETMDISNVSTTKKFYLTSDRDWTISSDSDWLHVSQDSGSASVSELEVTFTADANNTEVSRTGVISVKAGDDTKTVTVTQDASQLSLEPYQGWTELQANGSGFEFIHIISNINWKLSSDQTWLGFDSTSGSGEGYVMLKPQANPYSQARSATITLSNADGSMVRTLTVTQAGVVAKYTISGSKLTYAEELEDGGLYVVCNKYSSGKFWTVENNKLTMTSHSVSDQFTSANYLNTSWMNPRLIRVWILIIAGLQVHGSHFLPVFISTKTLMLM